MISQEITSTPSNSELISLIASDPRLYALGIKLQLTEKSVFQFCFREESLQQMGKLFINFVMLVSKHTESKEINIVFSKKSFLVKAACSKPLSTEHIYTNNFTDPSIDNFLLHKKQIQNLGLQVALRNVSLSNGNFSHVDLIVSKLDA